MPLEVAALVEGPLVRESFCAAKFGIDVVPAVPPLCIEAGSVSRSAVCVPSAVCTCDTGVVSGRAWSEGFFTWGFMGDGRRTLSGRTADLGLIMT